MSEIDERGKAAVAKALKSARLACGDCYYANVSEIVRKQAKDLVRMLERAVNRGNRRPASDSSDTSSTD